MNRMCAVCVVGAILGAAVTSAHADNLVNVSWSVQTAAGCGSGINQSQTTTETGPVNGGGTAGCSSTDGSAASSTMSLSADFGALSASGSGSATDSRASGALSSANPYVGGAPISQFHDGLTIASGLADGTPVVLQFTETFTGTSGGTAGTGSFDSFINNRLRIEGSSFDYTLTSSGTLVATYTTSVGALFYLDGMLYGGGDANENLLGTGTASFNFSGSSTTCIDVLTPDVTFTTDSGRSYCSAAATTAPEPGSLLLLGSGLVVLGGTLRRRISG